MIRVIGISGSLRRASYNSAVLRAAATLMPAESELQIASIADFPLYNGDEEAAHGVPESVSRLKEAIAGADGVLFATPEYNNSLPGVAKNAIDWLSRPPADIRRVFGGLPFALVGASPGRFGTVLAQSAWLPVLRTLGAELWVGGRVFVSRADTIVDADGGIADPATRDNIQKFLDGFVVHIGRRQAAGSSRIGRS
jgi:NAD(P)H-dependent FMN reductase